MDNTKLIAEARQYHSASMLLKLASALEAAEAELTRRDTVIEAAREQIAPLPDDARMEAYYYGFERTGVGFIDAILSAVAVAGKGSHHTDGWGTEDGYGYYEGRSGLPDAVSAVDLIQQAAQQAADAVLAAAPVSLEAAKAETTTDRHALESAIGAVVWNASNHPTPTAVMGRDISPLRSKLVDAVLAAGFSRHASTEGDNRG